MFSPEIILWFILMNKIIKMDGFVWTVPLWTVVISLQWDIWCLSVCSPTVSVRREIIDPAFPPPIHHKRKWDIPSAGLGHRGNGTICLWNNKRRSSQQWLLLVLAMFKKWDWNVKTPFSSPSSKECPYSQQLTEFVSAKWFSPTEEIPFICQITQQNKFYISNALPRNFINTLRLTS